MSRSRKRKLEESPDMEDHVMNSSCSFFEESSRDFSPNQFAEARRVGDLILTIKEAAQDFAGNGDLCDVNIRLSGPGGDNVSIKAHSIIMAAHSSYFKAALSQRYKEGRDKILKLDGVDASHFKILLNMIYGMPFDLNEENIFDIYPLADYFCFDHPLNVCLEFIKNRINIGQALEIWKLAKRAGQYAMVKIAKEYSLTNFSKLMKSDESGLYDLNAKQLLSIIRQDDLKIRCERKLLDCVYKWVSKGQEGSSNSRMNDENFCRLLFHGIRLGKMSRPLCSCGTFALANASWDCTCGLPGADNPCPKHAPTFQDYPLIDQHVRGCTSCSDNLQLLQNQLRYGVFPERGQENLGRDEVVSLNWYRPRTAYEAVVAIGGWSENSPTGHIQVYNTRKNTWTLYPGEDTNRRAYHGLVELNGSIYAVGGFNGEERLNTLLKLDIKNNRWETRSPMHERRCYVSVVSCAGCIYAIGGHDGEHRLRTCEKYNPDTNQWSQVPSMNCTRSDGCAAAMDRRIYALGGFDGETVHPSVEVLDTDHETGWTFIAPMNFPRSGVRATCARGKLCVIGGFNGERRMKSMEIYDEATSTWEVQPAEMTIARSNFGVETFGKYLVVLGGYDDERRQTADNCEIYCFTERQWYPIASLPVPNGCSALAAVTLRRMNAHREFSNREGIQLSTASTNQREHQ